MKHVLSVSVALSLALAGGSTVSAQGLRGDEPPVTVTVSSPASGSTVGRTVTFSGKAKPNVGLSVTIDDNPYVVPGDRHVEAGREFQSAGVADANGNFSFSINLNGDAVREAEGGAYHTISAGRHVFRVQELYAPDSGQSPAITLNVSDGSAVAAEETEVTPAATATPTPSPSPSASPEPLTKDAFDANDALKLLLAAALGGTAAYGLHRLYYRKRRKK